MAQNWLYKLRFEYKDIYNNIFIKGYEHSNVFENQNKFLIKMEEHKSYMIKFEENNKMKSKSIY